MNNTELVKVVAQKLAQNNHSKNVIAGFDGFIDEILHIIKEKKSATKYVRLNYMKEFADRIAAAAGFSGNLEYASQQIKFGGNGPIMANCLIEFGHKINYIGTIGKDNIHPIFQDFANKCEKVTSFLNPGLTDSIEFLDGKMMMGRMNDFDKMSFTNIVSHYPVADLIQAIENSALIIFANWTSLPEMNTIYDGFAQLIAKTKNRPGAFIDLADPTKRSPEEIKEAMYKLSNLNNYADVILGLNENESVLIANSLNIGETDIKTRASKIREVLNLAYVVIHPISGAAVATKNEAHWFDGPFTPTPKLTTGAGDNFNAGFCNGWLTGLSPQECLISGVSTSGFYVRNGHSPNRDELVDFMQKWADVNCGDI
ncbi:MAG: carbohydrate kinase family protein [Candidatus Cloacimonetes bacterium]|nr:carbohydrate kinase family protein [Candidatus Cloacimonadota bacterium]